MALATCNIAATAVPKRKKGMKERTRPQEDAEKVEIGRRVWAVGQRGWTVGGQGHTLSGRVTRGRGNSLTMPTNTIQ